MGCNCGKNRSQPTGYGQVRESSEDERAREERSQANAMANAHRANRSGSPGPTGMTQSFQLQARDGSTQSFGSKLEADAARIRAGGGTIRAV